ncbi:MAG: transaldolase family protein [Conexivisphaera sp.]
MRVFLDSGDIDEIREAISWGVVDGVTTNPTLMREALSRRGGADIAGYVEEVLRAAGPGRPVSLEVMSTRAEDMVREGMTLYERFNPIAGNVVVKVPVNTRGIEEGDAEGLRAMRELSSSGVPVNATLIMTPAQAALAAAAGARYVSPFLGRVDDYVRAALGIPFSKGDHLNIESLRAWLGRRAAEGDRTAMDVNSGILGGAELVRAVRRIFEAQGLRSEIIAASIRNPRQAEEALEAGAHVITVPMGVLRGMMRHPKTEEGVRIFAEDARRANYWEIFGPGWRK